MDHIFLMVKASSMKMKEANIIEIASIRTNGQLGSITKRSVLAAFTSDVSDFKSTVKELEKNILDKFDNKYVVVTHISDITKTLLRNGYEKNNIKTELFDGRAWVDINQLAWPLVASGIIPNRQLQTIAKHFELAYSETDSADLCTVLVNIYGHMMRQFKTALIGEEAVRDFGGETFKNIRQMMGF